MRPERIAHDAHPDYFTTRFAVELGLPRVAVGHHEAHFAACLAEHGHWGPALGVVWDGAGLGADGGIWGGEFLLRDDRGVRRVGSIWPFPLIGGDRAAREPRRSALGVHLAAGEPPSTRSFTESELRALVEAARVPRLAPTCTGVGRLFDAWASLLGILDRSAYEAEAATLFEEIADAGVDDGFDVEIAEHPSGIPRLDWRPWVAETRRLLACGFAPGRIAAMFHNGLARGCLAFARRIGCGAVALTGGCFQNRYLSERVERSLASDGFHVLTHRLVPPGDGGLAVGQIVAAAWSGGSSSCV